MSKILRELVICAVAVLGILWLMSVVAKAEQQDPKQLTQQIVEQYVKNLINIQHITLGIELPDQLDVGLKHTRYQFQHGGAIKIKNRSPDDVTYSYHQGNHALEITQHTIGYRFEKRFNWTR